MLSFGKNSSINSSSFTYTNVGAYRFGFQGQEMDDEVKEQKGTSINYKYRMHDPRVGRFFAVDSLAGVYPWNSPYAFSENRLVDSRELEGLEQVNATISKSSSKGVLTLKITYNYVQKFLRKETNSGMGDQDRIADVTYKGKTESVYEMDWRMEQALNNDKKLTGDDSSSDPYESRSYLEAHQQNKTDTKVGRWSSQIQSFKFKGDAIYYGTNQAEEGTTKAGKTSTDIVGQLAAELVAHPELGVTLTGHTSIAGVDAKNLQLSKDRANDLKLEILKQAKNNGASVEQIKSLDSRITTQGFGSRNAKIYKKSAEAKGETYDDENPHDRRITFTYN